MINYRKLLFTIGGALILFAGCKNNNPSDALVVSGEIKNAENQQVYLEELYFTDRDPDVLDTAELKNGRFELRGRAAGEGLFRVRMEKNEHAFLFINDRNTVSLNADASRPDYEHIRFSTPRSRQLGDFIISCNRRITELDSLAQQLKSHPNPVETDSAFQVLKSAFDQKSIAHKKYIIGYADTVSNASMAMFVLGFTRDIEPEKLQKTVLAMPARFPGNEAVAKIVADYQQMMDKARKQESTPSGENTPAPAIGQMAPEITMPDTSGNMFSLSSLRGKYVLVDFWASWCGPCRGENPNVVKAFRRFSPKNFTVLGVSLDRDKQAWLNAIREDGLTWTQVSDLKYWNSAATALYKLDAIPYNVLLDPSGKIIASNLRGSDLEKKLEAVLK